MHFPRVTAFLLSVFALSCMNQIRPSAAAPFQRVQADSIPNLAVGAAANSACTLAPGSLSGAGYVPTAPDAFRSLAWRIPFAACTACPSPQKLELKSVKVALASFVPCAAQADVSIVGSKPGAMCILPDLENVLCGPTTYALLMGGTAPEAYTLAIPAGCCVTGQVFVIVTFTGLAACAPPHPSSPTPELMATGQTCAPCDEFITTTVVVPEVTDWCGVIYPQESLWWSLDADCCLDVPTRNGSWGTLKTTYR